MGIALRLVNHNELFYKKASRIPIIINDFDETSEEDKEALNRLIYTKYSSDLLSNLHTCGCGEDTGIVGEHNDGIICPVCNLPVQSTLEQDLEPMVWVRSPVGIKALINPIVWNMLTKRFMKSGFDVICWLCDTTYRTTVRTPAVMADLLELNIPRGYNNFIDNFDDILSALFNLKDFKPKKGTKDYLPELIRQQRDCIFSDYLPLPNKALLIIEETNTGTYVDDIIVGAVDAIRTMASIDSELSSHNLRTKENKTVKTIAQLSEFYDDLYRTTLAKKEGIFRKHVFGTRSHFSFRAVISSITEAHNYDELYIPWGIGISVFRIHLMNKLLRLNYTPNAAIAFLNEHAQKYHVVLDELFKTLIAEAPNGKIPVVLQRNPSLERG